MVDPGATLIPIVSSDVFTPLLRTRLRIVSGFSAETNKNEYAIHSAMSMELSFAKFSLINFECHAYKIDKFL